MGYARDEQGLAYSNSDGSVVVRIPRDGTLSLLVDTGCSQGPDGGAMLIKHGEDEQVSGEYRWMWSRLQQAAHAVRSAPNSDLAREMAELGYTGDGMQDIVNDMDLIQIPVSQVSDAVIIEVNACLEISGRVAHLRDRLAELGVNQSPRMPERPTERSLSPVP